MASLELKLCENVEEEQICVNETILFKFSPREIKSNRAIIFFHGGGFVIGNVPYYRHFLSQIGTAANIIDFFLLYFSFNLVQNHVSAILSFKSKLPCFFT